MAEPRTSALIENNLQYLNSLTSAECLNEATRTELTRSLQFLNQRASSDEVQLTVFGEFNAGKSTFINALLGRDLLTTQWRPTTQVCVYLRYGQQFQIVATLPDGSTRDVPLQQAAEVLSEQGSLRHVTKVEVHAPDALLQQGLVIVDTPGINVDIDRHLKITEKALAEANACIFMMSARQPGAKTSLEYLRRLGDVVDRLFVVLNMCDLLDEDELQEAVEYLDLSLRQQCGISRPHVYTISSVRGTDGTGLGPGGPRFQAFQERLSKFMQAEKRIVIAREIAKLQRQVMADAAGIVEARRRLHEEDLARRFQHALPDSETLVRELSTEISRELTDGLSQLRSTIQGECDQACGQIRDGAENHINSATGKGELQDLVPKRIEEMCQSRLTALGTSFSEKQSTLFQRSIERIDSCFQGLFASVRGLEFQVALRDVTLYLYMLICGVLGIGIGYQVLRALWPLSALLGVAGLVLGCLAYCIRMAIQNSIQYQLRSPVLPDLASWSQSVARGTSTDLYRRETGQLVKETAGRTGAYGTYSLITYGDPTALIAAPIITGVLAIGRALWDWAFGPSLEERKQEMRERVRPQITSVISATQRNVRSCLDEFESALPRYCLDRIGVLDRRYEGLLMRMVKRQRTQMARVRVRVDALRDIEKELAARQSGVQTYLEASARRLLELAQAADR